MQHHPIPEVDMADTIDARILDLQEWANFGGARLLGNHGGVAQLLSIVSCV